MNKNERLPIQKTIQSTILSFISKMRQFKGYYIFDKKTLLTFLAIGICLFFIEMGYFYIKLETLKKTEEKLRHLEDYSQRKILEKNKKQSFKQAYFHADGSYLQKTIEPLTFLEPEVNYLKVISALPAFAQFSPLKQRLQFLTKGKNQAKFELFKEQKRYGYIERQNNLLIPITIDDEDLKRLLTLIEGVCIGKYLTSPYRPQMFFKLFELSRKSISEKHEVFSLNMKIITRELTER